MATGIFWLARGGAWKKAKNDQTRSGGWTCLPGGRMVRLIAERGIFNRPDRDVAHAVTSQKVPAGDGRGLR